jgi:Uma2 family endonuclease
MSEYDSYYKLEEQLLREPEAVFSYADYLHWTFEERVELIKGKLFKMSPAPRRSHQEVHANLFTEIGSFLKGQPCRVYSAPFDVRFPARPDDSNEETFTVVQPDICVVCDARKLDEAGCKGAPDLIVEILSPSTASKDLHEKFDVYEENGVKEYWLVYPGENILEIFDLVDGKYVSRGKFVRQDAISSRVLSGLMINLEDIFDQV